ncbi:uncharacterized protein LOC126234835 [Schistocerca nitens]|uniref:uncharacterized protein LOC126234835 n=1 Tax=Schistocerca nitens TaxID=7011 RepID=UPI002118C8D0|nr:uncharacterized protein LOC126234835 [Schistocerca nitens]
MPPAQLHAGAPRVVAPAPAVPLQSPPPSELMDVDPSAGPPSQAVAVQPVLQPLSLGTPKESDTAAPYPAPTQQPSPQRQETLPLFVGPDAPSRPVPEAAPVVTGVHPDLGFQSVFPEAPRSQCWDYKQYCLWLSLPVVDGVMDCAATARPFCIQQGGHCESGGEANVFGAWPNCRGRCQRAARLPASWRTVCRAATSPRVASPFPHPPNPPPSSTTVCASRNR